MTAMALPGPFRLSTPTARRNALQAVSEAPEGYWVTLKEEGRNLEQNARLHAMLADIVKAKTIWDGETHDIEFWKGLVVSGWAIATKAEGQVVRGIEGEIVLIRRSTASMTKKELTSLLDYLEAFMAKRGIPMRGTA